MSPLQSVAFLLNRGMAAGLYPGAVAMWGSPEDKASIVACGTTSLEPAGHAPDMDTWYDLASLTKPLVTGTLCVLGSRQGLLAPSTRVGEIFSGVRAPELAGVTVSELLTHTSGLPAWVPLYALADGNPNAARRALLDIDLVARPGVRVEYSCPGFILLGMVLERVFDLSLDQAFERWVSGPLKISQQLAFTPRPGSCRLASGAAAPGAEMELLASLDEDRASIPTLAPGAPDDGNARFLGGVAGNAGLFGSARGVFRFALELLGTEGVLLDSEEIHELTRLRTRELKLHRAWAWQIASSPGSSAGPALSPSSFGHTGFTGTSLWIDPEQRKVFVLLTNRIHPCHRGTDLHPLRRRFHALAS